MAAGFKGFTNEAPKFFRNLARNNNRDWFEAHKSVYLEHVKAPLEALVEAVGAEMLQFDPAAVTAPAKAIYRIYRDTRFSSDKTPYKTHAGASFFRADLGKHVAGGYYFEISHRYVGVAGGTYMPTPETLRLMRVHILENHERWARIMNDKRVRAAACELQGETLSRPPKGFPCEHPALEWLKYKQMYYWQELPASLVTSPNLLKEIVTRFRLMKPLIEFLNEPLLAMKNKRAPLETGWV